jgi:hypothetical protein
MEQTPIFTRKFTAEFNTAADTVRQIATMEWNIDEMFRMVYAGGVDTGDINGIKNIYHYLVFVYADRLWSMAWESIHKDFKEREDELKLLYDDWIINQKDKVPVTLLEKLREYKRWLYEVKQKKIKMGVPTKDQTTAKERLKSASGL